MKAILSCACTHKWGDIAPLVLRIAVGAIFAMHGWQKLEMGIPGVSGFLGQMGFPLPEVFAVLLIAAELLGGLALIFGVFTHWTAKILALVAIIAFLTVHMTKGFFLSSGGYEYIVLIFAVTLSILITGPGKYSLDHKMSKK